MKINYQYADLLNEEQKHTKHKHTNNTEVQRKDDRQTDTCSENFTQIYSAKKIL